MPHAQLPSCIAKSRPVDRNTARQLLAVEQEADIVQDASGVFAVLHNGERFRVMGIARGLANDERAIKVPQTILNHIPSTIERDDLKWIGHLSMSTPLAVSQSLTDAFHFLGAQSDGLGLRIPQLGAIHAVLGYWTTGVSEPGTVVMPTGTGKTETMVALFAAERPARLLIVVPSDALRQQIAGKFEVLGVLQQSGVIGNRALRPVVGQLAHGFGDAGKAADFAALCNVIVTTPQALFASDAVTSSALLATCSHLFVDEAHHVEAATWRRIRDAFDGKPVLQFTATPYREDGRRLLGRQVYCFPLREAQRLGYFSPIDYTSVIDFTDPDRTIATRAVERLREDISEGFDHILMARVSRIGRALEVLGLYEEIAPDFEPVVLHSSLTVRERIAKLDAIQTRQSRIIVCVDMLGEGFDLPALKIAAIHDPHKSLGVTLQFVGRFARASTGSIGTASVFVGRPESGYDDRLRRLYAEDAAWDVIIRDLSEAANVEEQDVSEFEAGFGAMPSELPIRRVQPKMSTVIYRTQCQDWQPEGALTVHSEENILTLPLPVNAETSVMWFVAEVKGPIEWGDLPGLEQITYHLYVLYWDAEHQLLYINSSDKGSHHEELARAICGQTAKRIIGEAVYRAMYNLQRLVPTNVGLLDVRNQSRRFSLLVGADVGEGFPVAEAQTKTKTNIFASGFENGEAVTVGASLKGRIWSFKVAHSLKHWVNWCNHIGRKVSDETISPNEVMGAFIRPVVLQDRPNLVPLAIEWPWEVWLNTSNETRVSHAGNSCSLLEAELRVIDFTTAGPIRFLRRMRWSCPRHYCFVLTATCPPFRLNIYKLLTGKELISPRSHKGQTVPQTPFRRV